jgi:transposase InsO family protein
LDFIGNIHPPSAKGHCFVIVATDYFTNWTKAIPLKNMTHKEVIGFITEHITHRFGIPQTLTMDQGTSFVAKEVRDFVNFYGIRLLNSSPYYDQDNGQAETSNKTLVKLIKKKIEDNPKNGMKCYLKLYGLIVSLDMGLLKLLLFSLCMVKRPFYLLR